MDTRYMHELCAMLSSEIAEMTTKIRNAGGRMSAQDLELVDKLTHALKSVKTTLAMVEYKDTASDVQRDQYKPAPRDDLVAKIAELINGAM